MTHPSLNVAALPLLPEKRRPHPVLDALDEIVRILTAPETPVSNLAKALDLLDAELDLRDGRVALLDPEGRLTPVAGPGAGQPPETPTPVLKNLLGAGTPAAIRLGRKKTSLLAAPVWFDGKIIGLLTVHRPRQSKYARRLDENLRLLGLVANLIGPSLFASRRPAPDAKSGKAPEKPEARKIVGESAVLKSALAQARRVAPTNLSVLLRGESGSGKELFAQLIHEFSPRREKPFIKVNCAALPEGVLESELFGHERGAFTGADAERKGRFELADGGTLLLDEIGDIPLSFQAKLLRVLQEGEYERRRRLKDPEGRCARDHGHPLQSRSGDGARRLSSRSLLPDRRRAHSPARAARKARRYSASRQSCAGALQCGKRSRPDVASQFDGAAVPMRLSGQCPRAGKLPARRR